MHLNISREQIDSIKRQTDIVAVIAERGIKLKRIGQQLFALCPFHEERSASLAVSPERGLFHCFGCDAGGDVIGFVMRFDRVSFPEAVRVLEERASAKAKDEQERPT